MQVEVAAAGGHDAAVLAKKLIKAIEAHVRTGVSYAAIARAAAMTPQQLANLKAAVEENPAHVIKSDVAERLAGSIGYEVTLTPKGGAS